MKYKSIFSTKIARYLLKCGNTIYDIKPDKNNTEKTIFIFEETEHLKNNLDSLKSNGEVRCNKYGLEMKIVKYENKDNVVVEFQDETKATVKTTYEKFFNGNVKHPYKSVYGVGNAGNRTLSKNGERPYSYDVWVSMLKRCYSKNFQEKHQTYIGCKVCDEWLYYENFVKWYDNNYYEIEGKRMCLDKDILIKGNKLYSPDTCVFVTNEINMLFVKRDKARGEYPIGVCLDKRKNRFVSNCSDENGKTHFVGLYHTPHEAFLAYKEYKESVIKKVAENYKDKIPKKLYDAMLRYEVEETD